jgi:hypothetical protein
MPAISDSNGASGAPDPVPSLFLTSYRLAPVLKRSLSTLTGERGTVHQLISALDGINPLAGVGAITPDTWRRGALSRRAPERDVEKVDADTGQFQSVAPAGAATKKLLQRVAPSPKLNKAWKSATPNILA